AGKARNISPELCKARGDGESRRQRRKACPLWRTLREAAQLCARQIRPKYFHPQCEARSQLDLASAEFVRRAGSSPEFFLGCPRPRSADLRTGRLYGKSSPL